MQKSIYIYICMAFCAFADSDAIAQVQFTGSVSVLIDDDINGIPLQPNGIRREAFSGSDVFVYRQGLVGQGTSDPNGNYEVRNRVTGVLGVVPGSEVQLLIDGGGKLKPDLKFLTATLNKDQVIHVTLLTYGQFQRIYGREELVEEVKRIIRFLRRVDVRDRGAIKELEERIRQSADVNVP